MVNHIFVIFDEFSLKSQILQNEVIVFCYKTPILCVHLCVYHIYYLQKSKEQHAINHAALCFRNGKVKEGETFK